MTRKHVLVIDDDDRLRALLRKYLLDRNFIITDVATAIEGLSVCDFIIPDIIVLDIMLPEMDGHTFAKKYKKKNNKIPILMLSSLGQAKDRIKGLKNGAVDYLVKPFNPEELLLRINLAIKASWRQNKSNKQIVTHAENNLRIVSLQNDNGGKITLTEKESLLYNVFKEQQSCVISRSTIAKLCVINGCDRAVDVLVMRLRRKLLSLPKPNSEIKSIRGKGYIFYR